MNTVVNSKSLIIEASAGSGKTYQLINRLVQLLLNGAKPSHIVAITFTRKAAAEMQTRLQERLYDLAIMEQTSLESTLLEIMGNASTPLLDKARGLYEEVIFSPQSVRCSTFHSFCQEILKRFPFEAEVPPGFELSESTAMLKQQAWQALMTECEQNKHSSTNTSIGFLFDELGLNNTRDCLNSFLEQRSDWWAWTQPAKNPVGYAINKMQALFDIDPKINPLESFFNKENLDDKLSSFCHSLGKLKAKTYTDWLDKIANARDTSLSLEERHQNIRSAFLTDKGTPRKIKVAKSLASLFDENEEDNLQQSHINICSTLEELNNNLLRLTNYHINKHWYIAGEAYLSHYQNIKYSLRQLDFTDLEWQTYCLLTKSQHALWVQYKLDARINHLLIDEFQDTNPIQWRLLQPLIEEFSQQQNDKTNPTDHCSVLLVGDTKQSIYRFRRAEPKLFPIASKLVEDKFSSERLQLNASWRSSPAIINFVNTVFSETHFSNMIESFPLHQTALTDLQGSVTLLDYPSIEQEDIKTDTAFRNPLEQPRIEKQSEHQLEAKNIANKIKSLIEDKTPITISGITRNIEYQDIIILLRNRTNAKYYEKALHQSGIPFVGSERGTLLDCLEVSDIIMLLNWLITPFNNIALVSILRSPLFSVSDKTLIQLAQIHSKDVGMNNWFTKIEVLLSDNSVQIDSNLDNAFSLLKRWQTIATQIPVHDLLDVIYNEADVLAQYQHAYPAHLKSRTQTNLTRLIELALDVDSGRYPSLQQFIAHIQQIKNSTEEAPDTPAASNDKNRVQVMTIHASKGLEAPIIFLANADAGADTKDKYTYKTLIDWPAEKNTPNMMLLANSSKQRDDVSQSMIEKDKQSQQRETANLFYVAITRARQHLYISAAKPTKNKTDWYNLIQSGYDIASLKEDDNQQEIVIESHLSDTITANDSSKATEELISINKPLIDSKLNSTLSIDTHYQDIQQSISPSQLTNAAATKNNNNAESNNADATNRGIIIHATLENICNHPDLTKSEILNKLGFDISDTLWNEYWAEAEQVVSYTDFSTFYSTNDQSFNEVSISYLDNNKTVYGIIDRIVVTDNTVHIIDYKTHQNVSENNLLDYAKQYQPQLNHYQTAAKKLWPNHSIQSYLLFTHSKLLYQYTDALI